VVFKVDSRRCFMNSWANNNGITTHQDDYRHASPIKTVLF
jgi:hypothetical protein